MRSAQAGANGHLLVISWPLCYLLDVSMTIVLTTKWFRARWLQAKNRAGKRYTEHLNVSLPLAGYFGAVAQTRTFFGKFAELAAALNEAWLAKPSGALPPGLSKEIARIESSVSSVVSGLGNISSLEAKAPITLPLDPVAASATAAANAIEAPFRAVVERSRKVPEHERLAADSWVTWFSTITRAIDDIEGFVSAPMTTCTNKPLMLLLGPAGAGKTHLLCDMTKQHIDLGIPNLLFLGQAFQSPFTNVLQALATSIGWTDSPERLFRSLNALARKRHTRCLISIDAINEGHRESWKNAIPRLARLAERYPAIAVVISCRTPFEKLLLPNPAAQGFTVANHYGFPPEVQSDAVEKYFKGYGIPLPEVPLLEEEFSNPLFLKLFCEALEKVTVRAKHRQIGDIAAGQKGMTHILEYFIDQKDRNIAAQAGMPRGLSWRFLKGDFTRAMATQHVQVVKLAEATQMADAVQPPGMQSGTLLRALINEDILAEDVIFDENSQPIEVVRLTYQKFADHLIARHLLAHQFDSSSKGAIKASLRDSAKLGFYFRDQSSAVEQINVVQALLIEFPTRIKNRGELLDYLGWDGIPIRICEAFIEGLYWREPKHVNTSTSRWINRFLAHDDLCEPTLNVLVALSVKPRHPYGATRLDAFLRHGRLVERDLFWTEYLRRSLTRGTPMRLLIWAEHQSARKSSTNFVSGYVSVLKWFLTSTQRGLRDRATHALFRLGLMHPDALFEETLHSLDINDPYVPERMLAASYGVAMALSKATTRSDFQSKTLPKFATCLVKAMFARNSKHGTTHILSRDYARRTIQLALLLTPKLLSRSQQASITPPFRFGGIRRWRQSEDRGEGRCRNGDAPLGMDFANYTLGRLVKNRAAYQQTPDYDKVKRQVLWRIYNLGYTLEAFSKPDQEIARSSWYQESRGRGVGKTDRYGKKYAWIAFYELAGYREDRGLLERDERISDADIDPSFPERPTFSTVFDRRWINHSRTVRRWMFSKFRPPVEDKLMAPAIDNVHGPWALLHGFVNRETEDKTIFTIFDGLFVRTRDVPKAIDILSSRGAVGRQTPYPEEDHYTYAGEIPWADTWHLQQYPTSIGNGTEKVEVFMPVRNYAWETYHSLENQLGGIPFPSKELATDLGLHVQIPSITMAQSGSAKPATVLVLCGEPHHNSDTLLFIRQDLLNDYLRRKGFSFVLLVWGERRANYGRHQDARHVEGHFEIKDVTHRQGFLYRARGFERFL